MFTFHKCLNINAFSLILLDLLSSLCLIYTMYALVSCIVLLSLLQVLGHKEQARTSLGAKGTKSSSKD